MKKIKFLAAYYVHGTGWRHKEAEGIVIEIPELSEFQFVYTKEEEGCGHCYVVREVESGVEICRSDKLKGIRASIEDRLSKQSIEMSERLIEYAIKEHKPKTIN